MSDEMTNFAESERAKFLGKRGVVAGPVPYVPPATERDINICRLTPQDTPGMQCCEGIIKGVVCVRVPTNLIWYRGDQTGRPVLQFLCVDCYSKCMGSGDVVDEEAGVIKRHRGLLERGYREVRHDIMPTWIKEWLRERR
jgi:hypothetical protein